MKNTQNTISFNGKLYDAVTGKQIGGKVEPSDRIKPVKPDTKQSKPKAKAPSTRTRAAHHAHNTQRRRQHSKTLMRQAVKKPLRLSHKISDLQASKPASHNIEPATELAIGTIKHNRSNHAAHVRKSHLIHRFADRDELIPSVVKTVAKIPVKTPSNEHVIKEHTSAPVSDYAPPDLFNQALSSATSHRQTLRKTSRRQRVAKKLGVTTGSIHFGMTVLAVVVLGGFVLYQNAANIRVRIAASDAGIHAGLPAYRPSGFAFNRNIQIYPGEIVLSFHSTTDSRNFTIAQATAPSENSAAIVSQITATGQSYQSVNQANGPTIYLYGAGNAAWIKGNTWYSIEGNSSLSSSQLLKIANSF